MKKSIYSFLYLGTILLSGLSFHQAFAQRSPSVEPLAEISIEEDRPVNLNNQTKGFDFTSNKVDKKNSVRTPANIVQKKSERHFPGSFWGPIIFLLALPIALWIAVAKRSQTEEIPEKKGYYPKTYQFKNYKAGIQDSDYENDDQDLPKAS